MLHCAIPLCGLALLTIPATSLADLSTPKEIGPLEGSYAQCILKKMPGVASDLAAGQIVQQCRREYPELLNTIESGSSWFGFNSGGDCVAKMARDTPSRTAALVIAAACYKRYGPNR